MTVRNLGSLLCLMECTINHNNQNYFLLQLDKLTFQCVSGNQTGCDWSCTGNRTNSTQKVKYVGIQFVLSFGYILSLTGQELKLLFVFLTLSRHGHWRITHGILIQIGQVLTELHNENHSSPVLVCNWGN